MATDPVAVVTAGLKGLERNRAITIPGLGNKVGAQSNRILPRALRHIRPARNELIRVKTGDAFDVVGERIRTDFQSSSRQDFAEEVRRLMASHISS